MSGKPAFCANCTRDSFLLQQEDWDGRLVWLCRRCTNRVVPDPPRERGAMVDRVERALTLLGEATSDELMVALEIGSGTRDGKGSKTEAGSNVYQAVSRLKKIGVIRAEPITGVTGRGRANLYSLTGVRR